MAKGAVAAVLRRRSVLWLLVVFVVFLAIWVKVRLEAGAALRRAVVLESEDRIELAIAVYRQTVRWYTPGSGPVAEAVDRLWSIGERMEADGDVDRALMAYRALRSGLYATRSLYQPYAERLGPASDRIAALMAAQEAAADRSVSRSEREAHHRALLDVDHAPNAWWSLLAVLAFAAWAWSLFFLATRAFDEETGRLSRPTAYLGAGAFVVTFAVWALALTVA